MNIAKCLRTPILKNICEQLLLSITSMLQYTSRGNYQVVPHDNSLKLPHLILRYLIVVMLLKKLSDDLKN